ncbi:fimbrial chaperone [Burkholderia sp. SFA1]|uniref:fimbria/pilus periplasmic chaperone n=1 Tax=unclassified Caballeronia TaxID=2646786 RepID=UPI001F358525|nr:MULTISPECIES: fimbria/pilus periplasmic chaperone [unclassified Caballeronia]MCE4544694.1 fimbria/pilus periplasmic chaperone [Caballeronia sp. PC1]MCE4571845.1 fimbria/pilus periplasmic chaperone [Caballeronia sp. CLC5]BBP98295.1 fimbrial chaperone [Burkholderia sp. SFA1]
MKLAKKILSVVTLTCAISLISSGANASVVIAGTRIVYNQSEPEVTVKLTNNGKLPGLTKVWLDKGDPDAKPDTIEVPFTITPPLMRIDPTKSQTLRIMFTGDPLPADKESIFYLNVLEVPPKATGDAASANQLQLAFRTRIKFFYRPASLKERPEEAPGKIAWHLKRDGGKNTIEASNPSQYYVSFDSVEYTDGVRTASFIDGGMVGPGETKGFPLKGELPGGEAKVKWTAINDYGGPSHGQSGLAP